jgi:hypothetical protein
MSDDQTNIGTLCVGVEAKIGSFVDLPGIESAIGATAFAAKNSDGLTLLILQEHLKKLCKLQRSVLSMVPDQDS